jgi:hypothetical protein
MFRNPRLEISGTSLHNEESDNTSDTSSICDTDNTIDFLLHSQCWPDQNHEILSRLFNKLSLSDGDCKVLLEELRLLDNKSPIPSLKDIRDAELAVLRDCKFIVEPISLSVPTSATGGNMITNPEQLQVMHFDLWDVVQDLLADPELANACEWKFRPRETSEGARAYDEVVSAQWWQEEQQHCGSKTNILALIFASDEVPVTMNGRNVHPVYVTLANLPDHYRKQSSSKRLYGFLPAVTVIKGFRNENAIRQFRRSVRMAAYEKLFSPIVEKASNLFLKIGPTGQYIHCVPRVPFLVLDEKELRYVCGLYGGSNASRPCNICLVKPKLEGITATSSPRQKHHMIQLLTERSDCKEFSIHAEPNFFLSLVGLNVFSLPSCRMHATDHGVFEHLLKLVLTLLRSQGQQCIRKFDQRWQRTGSFPFMKAFPNGVSELAFLRAFEFRSISMQLPFALHGLAGSPTFLDASQEDGMVAMVVAGPQDFSHARCTPWGQSAAFPPSPPIA